MGFSRQEYWSGVPLPTPGNIPDPGINLHLLHLLRWQADFFTAEPPGNSTEHDVLTFIKISQDVPGSPVVGTMLALQEAWV